jgi:hypothetical protein
MGFAEDIRAFAVKVEGNTNSVVRKTVIEVATSLIMKSPVGNPALWVSLQPSYRIMNKAGTKRLVRPKLEFKRQPPKGYSGGTFRANWQLGIGSLKPGELKDKDKTGGPTIAKVTAGIPAKPAGGVYFIGNNLDYGPALEDGHSTQAPFGMVSLTSVEFGGIVDQAVAGVNR